MKAIIIGAGIGGLAAAIALRKADIDVEIFERVNEAREVGAGLSLWANALKALDLLGLHDVIHSVTVPQIDGGIRDLRGRLLAGGSMKDLEAKYGTFVVVAHRAELQAAMLKALGDTPVQLNKALARFDQDANGVMAHFEDGSHARGDVLIGADGIRSAVRAQLHGRQPPTYSGYSGWRAVIPFDPARVLAGETWGHGARFGQVPMQGDRVYRFAAINAPQGEKSAKGEKQYLLNVFRGWHEPIEAMIEATPESAILRNDIVDRPVLHQWGSDRVTLIGDAAHPMTPNMGQGACQALEDAVGTDAVPCESNRCRGSIAAIRSAPHPARECHRQSITADRANGAVVEWGCGECAQFSGKQVVRRRAIAPDRANHRRAFLGSVIRIRLHQHHEHDTRRAGRAGNNPHSGVATARAQKFICMARMSRRGNRATVMSGCSSVRAPSSSPARPFAAACQSSSRNSTAWGRCRATALRATWHGRWLRWLKAQPCCA